MPPRQAPTSSRSAGFTLIEVCWTIAVFGVLAAIAATSLTRWHAGERHGATTSAIEAVLRETQQRAITEGRALCVSFDVAAQSYAVLRGACGSAAPVQLAGPLRPEGGVHLDEVSFAGAAATGVTFYPRGTATPGWARITRDGSDRADTLVVEGLTGRVSRA